MCPRAANRFSPPYDDMENRVNYAALEMNSLTELLGTSGPTATHSLCELDSGRVNSRFSWWLDDLSRLGRAFQLQFTVRRFLFLKPECLRRIFDERLYRFAEPQARATSPLHQGHRAIGGAKA